MFRFTIRELLILTLTAGLAVGWWLDHSATAADGEPTKPPALEGYCPVTLFEQRRWKRGDPKFQVMYEGQTYLLASEKEQKTFKASPTRFVPVYGGNDPIRLTEEKRLSPGRRSYGLTYNARIYLFDSEESMTKFAAFPEAYIQR